MKKLITILLISTIAMSLTFAETTVAKGQGSNNGNHNGANNGNHYGNDNGGDGTGTGGSSSSTSFDGSNHSAPDMDITLIGKLNPQSYDLSIVYGTGDDADNFTESRAKTISGLDLTTEGSTEEFNVYISNGNLNKSITFKTEITENSFVGVVNDKTIRTDNVLTVRDLNQNKKLTNTFSKLIKAGPNDGQSIARFDFHWTADPDLAAGSYKTTNTVSVSVE